MEPEMIEKIDAAVARVNETRRAYKAAHAEATAARQRCRAACDELGDAEKVLYDLTSQLPAERLDGDEMQAALSSLR